MNLLIELSKQIVPISFLVETFGQMSKFLRKVSELQV